MNLFFKGVITSRTYLIIVDVSYQSFYQKEWAMTHITHLTCSFHPLFIYCNAGKIKGTFIYFLFLRTSKSEF